MVISLGIEGYGYLLSVGIIDDNKVLINKSKYFESPDYQDYYPYFIATHHRKNVLPLIRQCLTESNLQYQDIDIICFSNAVVMRMLAQMWNKPIVVVNHAYAHIKASEFYSKVENCVVVYLCGKFSQIMVKKDDKYKIIGSSLDISIEEAYLKMSKYLKFYDKEEYLGATIEELSKKGTDLILLPYMINGFYFYLSGTLCSLQNLINNASIKIEDICLSFQEAVLSIIVEITEKAMLDAQANQILIIGQISENKRLQDMMTSMAKDNCSVVFEFNKNYSIDSGVMIALSGLQQYKKYGPTKWSESGIVEK
ncbi:hypothetical protein A3Q56_02212 [Intoshia linei]|uniref:N(6)-L-threonylcarbamoyladenine synthase n=1 Tax=Intoshia linei TaxID=1819745 RepID=A0A177B706_9BILA|nr:hypothetical protein A3Q56_02212 [Intoshia linei]